MSEDRVYPFRREHDWNVCGMARHDGKLWYQYWFHEGDVWELKEERDITDEVERGAAKPFRKRGDNWWPDEETQR